ncbi:MAG TPA: hypothetical protein VM261_00195 [Kofleriaceae bacterium]|nr:hypothetical protein [Kofleriaceae bacterium]
MRRALVVVAIAVVVVIAAAATRAVWAGGRALDDGDAALARGDHAEAIASWRRAARWYVPLVGASDDAFARLARLGTDAEARGDAATARAAWQAVRGAALAIRGATAPFDERRREADAHLAKLYAADPNLGAGATVEERTAWHARVLAGSARPTRGWLVLALAVLAAIVLGGAVVARRGRPIR